MAKTVTGAVDTALQAQHVPALLLVQLVFDSGTIYLTNATSDIVWNGQTWRGAGNLGKVDVVVETESLESQSLGMELSGVPSAYVSLAMNEPVQGRPAYVYFAPLNAQYQLLANPTLEWQGLMDVLVINDGGSTATIGLTVQSRLVDFARANERRFNNEDQQSYWPGDRFFEYVPQMVEKQIIWPSKDWRP